LNWLIFHWLALPWPIFLLSFFFIRRKGSEFLRFKYLACLIWASKKWSYIFLKRIL
jgi:hypothetical protein